MDLALGWIGDIARWVLTLFPHLLIVPATHGGVKFVHGWNVKKIGPGLHFYWPIVTEISMAPVRRQTVNLDSQYLVTADGKSIGVAGVLVYEVSDVKKLLTECWDSGETIQDMSLAAIKDVVTGNNLSNLQSCSSDIECELEDTLGPELDHFGIRILRITLTDLTPVRVLAHWGFRGNE